MNFKRNVYIKIAITVFLLYLAILYWPKVAGLLALFLSSAYPIILGLVMAYILNILMRFYERHYFPKRANGLCSKTRRPVCLVLAIFTLVVIVIFVVNMVLPELLSCIQTLFKSFSLMMKQVADSEFLKEHLPESVYAWIISYDWNALADNAYRALKSGLGTAAGAIIGAVSTVFSKIVSFFLAFIFTIYFLLGKEKLTSQAKRLICAYLNDDAERKTAHVLTVLDKNFSNFIVGQCTEALILGALCALGMWIFRFPYAVMIGTLVGFTALIPIAGAYIGAGAGVIMIATVSFPKALLFLLFIIILQQLEGNLIYPRVVGGSLNLPAIWVLAAITIGGGLMGVLGMLVGVPLTASLYCLLKEQVAKREEKEKSSGS